MALLDFYEDRFKEYFKNYDRQDVEQKFSIDRTRKEKLFLILGKAE